MIRLTISAAAYAAIADSLPKGHARPAEPVAGGVGVWIERDIYAAIERELRPGEGHSELILRLFAPSAGPVAIAGRARKRIENRKRRGAT
jgi:hypothetical protein